MWWIIEYCFPCINNCFFFNTQIEQHSKHAYYTYTEKCYRTVYWDWKWRHIYLSICISLALSPSILAPAHDVNKKYITDIISSHFHSHSLIGRVIQSIKWDIIYLVIGTINFKVNGNNNNTSIIFTRVLFTIYQI